MFWITPAIVLIYVYLESFLRILTTKPYEGSLRAKMLSSLKKFDVLGVKLHCSRSTLINAAASNWPPMRTIFFTDGALSKSNEKELMGALAHEAGHQKYYHSIKRVVWLLVLSTVLSVMNIYLVPRTGSLDLFVIVVAEAIIIAMVVCAICRQQELAADAFSTKHKHGQGLAGFLQKARADWQEHGYSFNVVRAFSGYPSMELRIKKIKHKQ